MAGNPFLAHLSATEPEPEGANPFLAHLPTEERAEPEGFWGGLRTGAERGFVGTLDSARGVDSAFTGAELPAQTEPTYGQIQQEKPMSEWITDLTAFGEFVGEAIVGTMPTLAATAAGGAAGGATPLPGGTLIGASAGAGLMQGAQAVGNEFVAAKREGLSDEEAWTRAWEGGLTSGGLGALPIPVAVLRPFGGRLKNLLFQMVAQTGLGGVQQAGENVVAGRPAMEGVDKAMLGEFLFEGPGTLAATRVTGASPPLDGGQSLSTEPRVGRIGNVGGPTSTVEFRPTQESAVEAPDPRAGVGQAVEDEVTPEELAIHDKEADPEFTAEHSESAFDDSLTETATAEGLGAKPTPKGGVTNSKIKQQIHKITGLYKVQDFVEVEETAELKRGLRKEQKASREGERAGVAKQKERNREQRLAEQARREYKRLVENISQPPEKDSDIDPEYQRKILEMQAGFDADVLTKDDVKRFAESKKAYEEGRAPDMPADMVERFGRRPFGEMTLGELRVLNDKIATVRKQGRLVKKLKKAKQQRAIDRDADAMAAPLRQRSNLGLRKVFGDTKASDYVERGEAALIRPSRQFEALDGFEQNGPWTTKLWRPVSDASYAARGRATQTAQWLKDGLSQLGRGSHQTALIQLGKKKRVGDGPELTGSERVGIAMLAVNDLQKITEGRIKTADGRDMDALTPTEVADIVNDLSPVERGLRDLLAARFKEQGPLVQEVYERNTGKRLDLQNDYFPNMSTSGAEISAADADAMLQAFKGVDPRAVDTTSRGFTKDKLPQGQQSVNIDALDVFQRNTRAVDYYLEMAEPLARARKIIASEGMDKKGGLKAEIQRLSTGGLEGARIKAWLNRWVEDSGKAFVGVLNTDVERAARYLRVKGTSAVLAAKITTMLKQPVSMLNAGGEAGYLAPVVRGVLQTLVSQRGLRRNAVFKEMAQVFPEVKYRTLSRELEDFERTIGQGNKVRRAITRTSDFFLQGLRLADKLAVTAVSKAVYDTETARGITRGLSEADAKAYAVERTKQVLERTQNDARTVALPQMFRDEGELTKMATIFGNELSQILNTNVANVRRIKAGKQGVGKTAAWAFSGLLAPAVSMAIINRAFRPEGAAENLPEELVAQGVGGIPVIGGMLTAIAHWMATGDPRQLDYIMDASPVGLSGPTRLVKGTARGLSSEFDDKAIRDMITGLASSVGLPGEALKVGMEGIEDMNERQASKRRGPESLIFSRYQSRAAGGR